MIKSVLKYLIDTLIEFESYFIKANRGDKKKLLIIRKDGLGDYILFYPTVKYYKEVYPDYEIILIVSEIAKDLTKKMTGVDNFIIFDKNKFSKSFFYRRNFLLNLKRLSFSIVIYPVVSREKIADLMIRITGAQEKKVSIPENIKSEIDKNLYFIKSLGAKIDKIEFPTITLLDSEIESADLVLKNYNLADKKFCVIFPGSNYNFKIWPLENYPRIIKFLNKKNIIPLICGSKDESVLARKIIDGLSQKDTYVDLTGKTDNVLTLAEILKKSVLYFGSDTGIAHLSVAVGTPTICLMGGGHFGRFFPYGNLNKNRIVYDKDMKCMNDNWKCVKNLTGNETAPCIKGIKLEDAISEIDKLIQTL